MRLVALLALLPALAVGACDPFGLDPFDCDGSADVSQAKAKFKPRVVDIFGNEVKKSPGKAISPSYAVHFLEIHGSARTVSFFFKKDFGISTPLTVTFARDGKKMTIPAAPLDANGRQFLKERLEELTTETVTVTSGTVSGGGKPKSKTQTLKGSLKISFEATVDTGPEAGTSFTGSFTFSGTGEGFVEDV